MNPADGLPTPPAAGLRTPLYSPRGVPAVAIACPYCAHRINLKATKPGRYRPKCPNCAQPFLLWVPEAPGAACRVQVLPSDTRVGNPQGGQQSAVAKSQAEPAQVAAPDRVHGPADASHVFGFARTNPDPDKDSDSHR